MVRTAFLVGLSLTLLTAFLNIGFIAIDDYAYTVAVVVPADRHTTHSIIPEVNFRSPLPSLMLHEMANVAAAIGIEKPTEQYRFILVVLGLFSFTVVFACARYIWPGSVWYLSLYFLIPLLLTRTMYESLAIPYLIASLAFAFAYWREGKLQSLLIAAALLCVGALFRFHIGLCFAPLFILPLIRKRWGHGAVLAVVGALGFYLSGLPDQFWKGRWHASLFDYVSFNQAHSHEFGVTPFYTYVLLFLGVTLPPALFGKVRNYPWRELLPALLYFGVFVGLHSMVGHKEERFMIPMIPIFVILLSPVAAQLFQTRWRLWYAMGLNALLLVVVSLNEPQSNVIGLARYLDSHPQISKIITIDDTLVLYPEAFIRQRPVVITSGFPGATGKVGGNPCEVGIILRSDMAMRYGSFGPDWNRTVSFPPGFAEGLMVKMNPKNNGRRGPIEMWRHKSCGP